MPLHADDGLVLAALHSLDDVVGRLGGDAEPVAGLAHGLMVEAVDIHLVLLVHLMEERVFLDVHRVGDLAAGSLL